MFFLPLSLALLLCSLASQPPVSLICLVESHDFHCRRRRPSFQAHSAAAIMRDSYRCLVSFAEIGDLLHQIPADTRHGGQPERSRRSFTAQELTTLGPRQRATVAQAVSSLGDKILTRPLQATRSTALDSSLLKSISFVVFFLFGGFFIIFNLMS